MKAGGGPEGWKICGYGGKWGGKKGMEHAGGLYIEKGLLVPIEFKERGPGLLRGDAGVVESQKRLCFDKDVTVEKDWPHLTHLICIRQSACIRLWRQRFENCV